MIKECEVEIKPCPCCGCGVVNVELHERINEFQQICEDVKIRCNNWDCNMLSVFTFFKREDRPDWTSDIYKALGIHRWNKRTYNSEEIGSKIKLNLPEPDTKR